jgi:uncharacterized membrane protein YphA (DoxX/SURF4 family)
MSRKALQEKSLAENLPDQLEQAEVQTTGWLARHSLVILRIALGIVFFWFGVLKFFPGLSPAQGLATDTIDSLSFGLIPGNVSIVLLATLECAIGLGFITGKFMRVTLVLLIFQMIGTITPLFLFPGATFEEMPYAPTLEGQYIIKNIVLVSAGLVLGATMRGGQIIAHPRIAERARRQEDEWLGRT